VRALVEGGLFLVILAFFLVESLQLGNVLDYAW
jgi:hypothetical protein